jgi:hypothetical protein
MKSFKTLALLIITCCLACAANAQLQLVTNAGPQCIFLGEAKRISVIFHNPAEQDFKGEILARIFQTSSASAVQLGEVPWKELRVLPGQTVLESVPLDFPAVKAETKFLIQWLENTNRVIGKTTVLVYPTNLLQTLQSFLSEANFGVFDPGDQFKPLLKAQGIKFTDLGETELDDFSGQLAVIGPFQSRAQVPDGLANRIETIAKKNVAVVWIQPPQEKPDKLQPSFYCVRKSQTAIVVVQPELISNLPDSPRAQLNLIYFCKLALNPQPPVLPGLLPP